MAPQADLADPPKPNVRKIPKSPNPQNPKKQKIQKSQIIKIPEIINISAGGLQPPAGRPSATPPPPRPPKIRIEVHPKCLKIRNDSCSEIACSLTPPLLFSIYNKSLKKGVSFEVKIKSKIESNF